MNSEPQSKTRKIRFVCISDTHSHAPGEGYTLPKGDVLVHAGDLTNQGSKAELEKAARWLEKADFAVKIVVAGNHDLSLDSKYQPTKEQGWDVTAESVQECRSLIKSIPGITYLDHSVADVYLPNHGFSVRVFGSPYSTESPTQDWAFQYAVKDADALWEQVPQDIDVLITHTPPAGHVDSSKHWREGGCPSLRAAVGRVRPALHVCGHCHEGRGAEVLHWDGGLDGEASTAVWDDPGAGSKKQSLLDLTKTESTSGSTAIVNASIMAKSWGPGSKAFNKPVVVDVVLPRREGL